MKVSLNKYEMEMLLWGMFEDWNVWYVKSIEEDDDFKSEEEKKEWRDMEYGFVREVKELLERMSKELENG